MTNNHRVALVTGAGGGLGRAIAMRLAREGFSLALIDQAPSLDNTADLVAELGLPVATARADVGDEQAVLDAVALLREQLGAIDCLVNNAGITNNIAPLDRMKRAAWDTELQVNLTGPFNLLQAVLPDMVARRWGRIVNIASMAARGGLYHQAGYSASKSGLLGLARNVTLEHARHGITCNSLLPGLIETPAVQAMPVLIRDEALALVPAGRTGTPDEVAALVAFLCRDEAAFINGAEIDIDGGAKLCPTVLGSLREVKARLSARANAFETVMEVAR